jgi:hypothetical protein
MLSRGLGEVLLLEFGDPVELSIPVRMLVHAAVFLRLSAAVTSHFEQLLDNVYAGRHTLLGEAFGDVGDRQIGPNHLLSHRIARGVIFQHGMKLLD